MKWVLWQGHTGQGGGRGDCRGGLCESGPGAAPSQAEPVRADFKTDPWLHKAQSDWWQLCESVFKMVKTLQTSCENGKVKM